MITDVLIIGGGQAGLSASYCLKERGIEHVVLERSRVGESWRSKRWDSFRLVTPNWQCALPGFHYYREFGGGDPDGSMTKDDIVHYLEAYRTFFDPPLIQGISVHSLVAVDGGFRADTNAGSWFANEVVIATGGYHAPKIPLVGARLPSWVQQLHSSAYKNPDQVGSDGVLVVGTGQSGCQIAEELLFAGKDVHLAVGGALKSPRWFRGRDVTGWLVDMGHYSITVDEHRMGRAVRKKVNHYLSEPGARGEIDLRSLSARGLRLHGRLNDIRHGTLQFRDDLEHNLNQADAAAEGIKRQIDDFIEQHGLDMPPEPAPQMPPSSIDTSLSMDVDKAGIRTVIWATGFDLQYDWLGIDAFDEFGYPDVWRGISRRVRGLYFLGLPWMWTWGSGRLSGVGADAAFVAEQLG